jgi:uncharacterized membrane protein
MAERFWEIDFARGAAVLAMLAFNWQFALGYFGLLNFSASSGFWWFFARATAAAFIFIAGLALSVSFAGASRELSDKGLREKYLKRGAKLFGLGMLVTLATWLFLGEGFVVFGVLHLIGFSIILAIPFLRLPSKTVFVAAAAAVLAGIFLSSQRFDFPWLLWLGFVPKDFYSMDYLPVLPWFGVVLFGLAFGKTIYPAAKRRFGVPEVGGSFFAKSFCFLGRHSLAVYVLHQPLLLALLYLLGFSVKNLNLFS